MRVRRPPTPAARRFWKLYTERPKPSEMLLSSLSSLVSLLLSPLSSFVMRVPGMRDARRNAQASDRSGRPTATAYLPCVNHRMWNKRRLALLARCLTARECKLSRTHIHRLSAVYARTPTASHRMSHPLSSACCVVLHVCRPLFSCRRISAPCPGRFVLLDSYCALRALI